MNTADGFEYLGELITLLNKEGVGTKVHENINKRVNDLIEEYGLTERALSGLYEYASMQEILFANANGNKSFVDSETVATGKTRRFFYNVEAPELVPYKQVLLGRKIKKFTKDTWFMWGRNCYDSKEKRIYVNCKTRQENPFFHHACKNFDGSILGIFPHNQDLDTDLLVQELNNVDWEELGFVCDGRFIFSQKALENCVLPKSFEKYLK